MKGVKDIFEYARFILDLSLIVAAQVLPQWGSVLSVGGRTSSYSLFLSWHTVIKGTYNCDGSSMCSAFSCTMPCNTWAHLTSGAWVDFAGFRRTTRIHFRVLLSIIKDTISLQMACGVDASIIIPVWQQNKSTYRNTLGDDLCNSSMTCHQRYGVCHSASKQNNHVMYWVYYSFKTILQNMQGSLASLKAFKKVQEVLHRASIMVAYTEADRLLLCCVWQRPDHLLNISLDSNAVQVCTSNSN